MSSVATALANRPAWIDLATNDAQAARHYYAGVFGWQIDVSDDPTYGGYATARIAEGNVGGIGPKQDPAAPSAWNLYIGTDDVDSLVERVSDAGGTVVALPFDVGDQGRMAVFADRSGGFISAWQGARPSNFVTDVPNSFGWAELNARDVANVLPFYEQVFGWKAEARKFDPALPPYRELSVDGQPILGAWEMSPHVAADVPTYWQVYFNVDDVDDVFARAIALGGVELMAPQDFPGGRFAIVSDPQAATFGLLRTTPR